MEKAGKAFLLIAGLIVICFIFISFITPEIYLNADIPYIIYAYLVTFAIVGLFSARWKNNTLTLGKNVGMKGLINMEFMSTFAKFLSPFQLNIPFRSFFLKDYDVEISDSISLSVFELFIEFLVACIGVAALGVFLGYDYLFILFIPLVLMAAFFVLRAPATAFFSNMRKKAKRPWSHKVLDVLIDLPRAIEKYSARFDRAVILFILTVTIYLFKAFRMWLIIRAFDLYVPFWVVAFLICAVSILSVISRIPMGIGVQELTGILLFSPFMEADYAFSVLLVARIIGTSVILVFGGGLFVLTYTKNIKNAISKTG